MTDITRYNMLDSGYPFEAKDGCWVSHEDHEAAIKDADAEALALREDRDRWQEDATRLVKTVHRMSVAAEDRNAFDALKHADHEAAIKEAVLAERKACAEVCERRADSINGDGGAGAAARQCAKDIRARGDKP